MKGTQLNMKTKKLQFEVLGQFLAHCKPLHNESISPKQLYVQQLSHHMLSGEIDIDSDRQNELYKQLQEQVVSFLEVNSHISLNDDTWHLKIVENHYKLGFPKTWTFTSNRYKEEQPNKHYEYLLLQLNSNDEQYHFVLMTQEVMKKTTIHWADDLTLPPVLPPMGIIKLNSSDLISNSDSCCDIFNELVKQKHHDITDCYALLNAVSSHVNPKLWKEVLYLQETLRALEQDITSINITKHEEFVYTIKVGLDLRSVLETIHLTVFGYEDLLQVVPELTKENTLSLSIVVNLLDCIVCETDSTRKFSALNLYFDNTGCPINKNIMAFCHEHCFVQHKHDLLKRIEHKLFLLDEVSVKYLFDVWKLGFYNESFGKIVFHTAYGVMNVSFEHIDILYNAPHLKLKRKPYVVIDNYEPQPQWLLNESDYEKIKDCFWIEPYVLLKTDGFDELNN